MEPRALELCTAACKDAVFVDVVIFVLVAFVVGACIGAAIMCRVEGRL